MLIAGGGTAGHVVPALALADVLTGRGHQVAFCGTDQGMENQLVPKAGYPLFTVRIRGFERRLGISTLRTLSHIPLAAVDAYKVLREARPDCVIGVGSHASGPVTAEAALRGIRTVAVEMDSHLGWTNTILSKLVDKVCLSYPDDKRKSGKFVYTGRPLRPELLRATREQGIARFGLDPKRPVLLVFGGSLGAHALNVAVLDAFADKPTPFQVLHVTGEADYAWVSKTLARPGSNPSYQVHAFLDDLPLALAAADAAVARAGGSVAEVLARGIPALLVPYPYAAGDHQTKNARRVEEAGAALVVANSELDAKKVTEAVDELLKPEVNVRMRKAAAALAVPDAADRIADVVVELLTRHAG